MSGGYDIGCPTSMMAPSDIPSAPGANMPQTHNLSLVVATSSRVLASYFQMLVLHRVRAFSSKRPDPHTIVLRQKRPNYTLPPGSWLLSSGDYQWVWKYGLPILIRLQLQMGTWKSSRLRRHVLQHRNSLDCAHSKSPG